MRLVCLFIYGCHRRKSILYFFQNEVLDNVDDQADGAVPYLREFTVEGNHQPGHTCVNTQRNMMLEQTAVGHPLNLL